MPAEYDFEKIETKWQKRWEAEGVFRASDDRSLEKFYVLIEFPYVSGKGLHVGHPRSYTALDAVARKRRMEGYNVLYPIGWDAFGLPTENYAIKTGRHPREFTEQNVDRFREQLKKLGLSFDWSREVDTTDPTYYKWTQWIFLRLFEKGLAYKDSVFALTSDVVFEGSTTDALHTITLTAGRRNRHNGAPGAGVTRLRRPYRAIRLDTLQLRRDVRRRGHGGRGAQALAQRAGDPGGRRDGAGTCRRRHARSGGGSPGERRVTGRAGDSGRDGGGVAPQAHERVRDARARGCPQDGSAPARRKE